MSEHIVDCRMQNDILPLDRWVVSYSNTTQSMFLSMLYNQLNFQTIDASSSNITLLWNYNNLDNINAGLIWLWGWEFEPTFLINESSEVDSQSILDHNFLCFGIFQADVPGTTPTTDTISTSFLYLIGLSLQKNKPVKIIHGYKYIKNYDGNALSFVSSINNVNDLDKYVIRHDSTLTSFRNFFTKKIKILMGPLNGNGTTTINITYDNTEYNYENIPCFSSPLLLKPKTIPFIMLLGGGNSESSYNICFSLSNLLLTGYTCTYEALPPLEPPPNTYATFTCSLSQTNFNSSRNSNIEVSGTITAVNSYTGILNVSLVDPPRGITLTSTPITIDETTTPVNFTFTLHISNEASINRHVLKVLISDGLISKTIILSLTVITTSTQIPDFVYVPITNDYSYGIHSSALIMIRNNKVLLIGGYKENGEILNESKVGIITEHNNTFSINWTPSTSYSLAVYSHSAIKLHNNRLLLIGGQTNDTIINDCYLGTFDNGNNTITWTQTTDYPMPISKHTSILLSDGRILVIGGWIGNVLTRNCYLGTVNENNTITWIRTTDYPFAIYRHAAIALDNNKVLVIGGNDGINLRKTCYIGTIENNNIQWVATNDYPSVIRDHTCIRVNNDYICVIGGFDGRNYINTNYMGALSYGQDVIWLHTSNYPITAASIAATSIGNNRFLAIGGWNNQAVAKNYIMYV